jgi:hypothetical protein
MFHYEVILKMVGWLCVCCFLCVPCFASGCVVLEMLPHIKRQNEVITCAGDGAFWGE